MCNCTSHHRQLRELGRQQQIRQAPHYYEPYFGYLLSFIMSYALHVVWLVIVAEPPKL